MNTFKNINLKGKQALASSLIEEAELAELRKKLDYEQHRHRVISDFFMEASAKLAEDIDNKEIKISDGMIVIQFDKTYPHFGLVLNNLFSNVDDDGEPFIANISEDCSYNVTFSDNCRQLYNEWTEKLLENNFKVSFGYLFEGDREPCYEKIELVDRILLKFEPVTEVDIQDTTSESVRTEKKSIWKRIMGL